MKRKALGKGLDALLPKLEEKSSLSELELDLIRPNPLQPRLRFEETRLQELADSLSRDGVLQPIVVRRAGAGFEIVAGERRWRAAQKAGLARIPAVVQDVGDERMLELALIENIQRDELSPIEEANAYRMMVEDFQLTQGEVARRVGRSRSAVANTLRLLKLPRQLQQMVGGGELSMGHARALLPLNRKRQLELAAAIRRFGLSVREVERRASKLLEEPRPPRETRKDPNVRAAERRLEEAWKTRVEILPKGKGGRILMHYHSPEELDRLYEALLARDSG
ncbi:MAG TPA: ParB/RepB/Spo0J family partition protein [Acidobacteriota bacterium]|nr:ParB/RepB/Spo0J family partition protein [Acidobacteriota bacterium]